MDLDRIDHRILDELRRDGRLSNLKLAERVGLSPSACLRRVHALEASGVIKGYRAVLDAQVMGIGLSVIVHIGLEHHDDDALEAFEAALRKAPNVLAGDMVSGRDDYVLRVGARDIGDYERVHREQLSRLPGVSRIESHFAFRKVVGD
jgi:DNA-binding Lrp family transcriptional regulator